jgi:hypothetical protein
MMMAEISPKRRPPVAKPDALIRTSSKNRIELEEKELDRGGASDIQIVKNIDKSSPAP